ncbi:hypothetical protein ACH5RR_010620 [Cinchona calisaya]|uniref:CCHC-type domain-containing protein n=1 Tax=Cinchona calisaya TaxID=153742 RepID=A0ABD3AJG0_9GENT
MNLWAEYTDIVYANLPPEGLSSVQLVHETTKKDQFLMKLRSEFESTRSSLMSREPVPSLDVCLNALFREEQRILNQSTMEQQRSTSVPMAYVAQGKPKGRDLSTIQCFCCKGFGHYASNCSKKFCNYCKKDGHIIKECPTRPSKKSETAYTVSVGSSSTGNSANIAQSASTTPAPPVTPEMIQQMIISAFSALGLSDSVPSKPLLVYQRRKSNTLDQTSTSHRPPPTHSLTADSVPTATLAPLRRGTRVHKPPDRRCYTHSGTILRLNLITELSADGILSNDRTSGEDSGPPTTTTFLAAIASLLLNDGVLNSLSRRCSRDLAVSSRDPPAKATTFFFFFFFFLFMQGCS